MNILLSSCTEKISPLINRRDLITSVDLNLWRNSFDSANLYNPIKVFSKSLNATNKNMYL